MSTAPDSPIQARNAVREAVAGNLAATHGTAPPPPPLNFRDLMAALHAIPAHDLAATNVTGVELSGTDVWLEPGDDARDDEIKELRETIEDMEREAKIDREERDSLAAKIETLEEMHREFRDPESGTTPLQYKERAEESRKVAESWRKHAEKCEAELEVLRRRKGVMPGYIAEHGNIVHLLQRIAVKDATFDGPVRAAEIFTRLRRSQKVAP